MSKFVTREALHEAADIVAAPNGPVVRDEIDRTFGLPTGLYVATAALYLGFVAMMAMAFGTAELALPLIIIAISILAGFGLPTLWARMAPTKTSRALTMGALKNRGIMTATGPLDAGSAAVQVLILPVLIFAWGLTAIAIAALV